MRELMFGRGKDGVVLRDMGVCCGCVVGDAVDVFVLFCEDGACDTADGGGKCGREEESLTCWGLGHGFLNGDDVRVEAHV